MKRLIQAFGTSLMFFLANCGLQDSTTSFSCDQTSAGPKTCTDYENYPTDATNIKDLCTQLGGTIKTTLCSRSGVIGGCRFPAGSSMQTVWYYSGTTAANIMQSCSSAGATFVSQ